MSSDSDDDFERFLQEDDSLSVSSASPMKRKPTRSSKDTKKSAASKTDSKTKGKDSASSRDRALGGSSSVVAAAQKLLAASGRTKAKGKPAAVEEDDDDEEPPPSYSADPYAFELDTTSNMKLKYEDDDSDRNFGSERKGKRGKEDKEPVKTKTSKKEKLKDRAAPAKKETKPTRTLDERVAEILKRTGSTTTLSRAAAEKKTSESDEEEDGEEDDGRDDEKPPAARTQANHNAVDAAKPAQGKSASNDSKGNTLSAKEVGAEDSDDGSGLHRLSFSDSLGVESADFEVGVLPKRKLDRSRLSLSSLNSEKFAVNLDALEESEQVSHNRYGHHNDDFHPMLDPSEAEESDYGDEVFELDQTTDGVSLRDATSSSPANLSEPADRSSFVSEFEKMKGLFSLDAPIEESAVTAPKHEEVVTSSHPAPPESDTFGYDEEDFENDEINAPTDPIKTADHISGHPKENQEYDDDFFDDDHVSNSSLDSGTKEIKYREVPATHNVDESLTTLPDQGTFTSGVSPQQGIDETNLAQEPVPIVVELSKPPDLVGSASATVVDRKERLSPPRSPPPPPSPDEDDEHGDVSQQADPPQFSLSQRATAAMHPQPISQMTKTADRFRDIEVKVSSLRFMRDKTQSDRTSPPSREAVVAPPPQNDDVDVADELKEIEQLMEQARRLRKGRRRSVVIQTSEKETELKLQLQQAQRQLLQFKHHVQELVADDVDDQGDPSEGIVDQFTEDPAVIDDHQGVHARSRLHREEMEQLKKEVQTQERLIRGFQRENEHLMKQLKQVQRDLHYDVHKENESLRIELQELRTRLDGTSNTGKFGGVVDGHDTKTQLRAAIEARLHAEALAVSLQEDLNAHARRHQDRVNELKIELEKMKKAKIEQECRYEGIDLEQMEAESRHIKSLKEELALQKTEHDHAIAALQKKIDWYVKNQRVLDDQDEQIKSLKEENKRLKRTMDTPTPSRSRSGSVSRFVLTPAKGGRHPADVRRIQDLESRLSDMEEAMRKRHPDSLVSLLVASRKAEEESTIKELTRKHECELAEMREEMDLLHTNADNKLNAFRQQQEKLVSQFQKQIADLERQLANKENQRGGAASAGRTQRKQIQSSSADETELYRVRRFYAEKIKEVERKWEAKYRALKKQHYVANGEAVEPRPSAEERTPSDSGSIIRTLQQRVAAQEGELRRNRAPGNASNPWETSNLQRRISSLEAQLKTSEDARRHLVETISSLHSITSTTDASPGRSASRTRKEDAMALEHEYAEKLKDAEEKFEATLNKYREQIEKLEHHVADQSAARQKMLSSQFSHHIKEVERLQKVLAEAELERRRLQEAAEMVPRLESEIALLRDQAAIPQTPSMLQFRSLELRIETLTQKHQLRETELKMLLAQATQSSQLEKLNYERMYQNAMALKNAEIIKFKQQLGEFLDELETLRRPPSSLS